MKKITLIITGFILLAFFTVRLPAQISPVASLNQQNTSIVNNNIQFLQSSINGVSGLLDQFFPGGIVQTQNGGTGSDLSNAATGDSLVISSSGTIIAGPPNNAQIFTTSGTYTPTFTGYVFLTMFGGGGGGGGGCGNVSTVLSGGGGGASEQVLHEPYPVISGIPISIVVGIGGTGGTGGVSHGAAGASTSGGNTSFGTAVAIGGGAGGSPGCGGGGGNTGGSGGYAGTINYNNGAAPAFQTIAGGNGGNGGTGSGLAGGNGGSTSEGKGGLGVTSSAGGNGSGIGAAGAGGANIDSTSGANGGNGTQGILVIEN